MVLAMAINSLNSLELAGTKPSRRAAGQPVAGSD